MNHEIMMRGGFGNQRLRNLMAPEVEGGITAYQPGGERMSIYAAALRYEADAVPLIVIAGHEYGTGSARDWAAKATRLLGVRAVIANSFERIHRSNLVGIGVMPCQFAQPVNVSDLGLDGSECFDIVGLDANAPNWRRLPRCASSRPINEQEKCRWIRLPMTKAFAYAGKHLAIAMWTKH
ncbi:aconitase A [Phyllobacterium sp. 1468]|nr:aconitase A [Phyllobacterium sp. 1468]